MQVQNLHLIKYSYCYQNIPNTQNKCSLKDHFKRYGANYDIYFEGVIINFKWNSLIYSLYQKQLDLDEELIKSELKKQIKEEKKN